MNESELFNAAVKLSDEVRAKFLDLACKDNPALRGQVESLLKAHFDSQTLLGDVEEVLAQRRRDAEGENQPPQFPRPGFRGEGRVRGLQQERDDDATSANGAETHGTIIAGKYKLLEAIGEGGMGTVWLAEQAAPVKRRVALKLIKLGMDSRHVLACFEVERQALALMDHPNIAKVYDGGITEQGRPYFVMEYVKGIPLTEYCDQAKLPQKERLKLFASVCQAVQHAHQKGIIHRDLKPSNILACLYDGVPVPKVIDFGLAKAMSQPLTEQSLYTAHGMMAGTPKPSTRLSELGRSGEPSRTSSSKGQDPARLAGPTSRQDPARLAGPTSSLASVAAQQSIEPKLLRKSLAGDLDWIVMKALEKERSRRYETANGFAADINRFLAGEAVLAHPPSQSYRMRKFLRKNKGPVLAAWLVFLALLAGVIGTAIGLYRAEAQRVIAVKKQKEAEDQRAKAIAAAESEAEQRKRAEKAEVETLKDFRESTDDAITQLIGSKDTLGPQEKTYVKNTLERWKRFADRVGDDQRGHAIRGEAHYRVGSLWNNLGQKEQSLAELQKAFEIRKQLVGQFPSVAKYQQDLAITHNELGLLVVALGKPEEGRTEHIAAVEIGQELVDQFPDVPEYKRELARAHKGLFSAIQAVGKHDDALVEIQLARDLLDDLVTRWPNEPEYQHALATTRMELGVYLPMHNKVQEAEVELEAALFLSKSLVEKFPAVTEYQRDLSKAYAYLATVHNMLGKLGKMLSEDRAALEIRKELVRQFPAVPSYRIDLAGSHGNLASTLSALGRLDVAIPEFQSSRDIYERLVEQFPEEPEYLSLLAKYHSVLGSRFTEYGMLDASKSETEAAVKLW